MVDNSQAEKELKQFMKLYKAASHEKRLELRSKIWYMDTKTQSQAELRAALLYILQNMIETP